MAKCAVCGITINKKRHHFLSCTAKKIFACAEHGTSREFNRIIKLQGEKEDKARETAPKNTEKV